MTEMSGNKKTVSNSAKMIRLLSAVLLIAGLFGVGVFLSRALDQRILSLVSDIRSHIKQKYGVSIAIGHAEAGFGALHLSEVSIGDSNWMVIDRIDVSVSFNPFNDFLRPSSMNIGRAVVKLPWRAELWPKEIKSVYELIKRRIHAAQLEETSNHGLLKTTLIPSHLRVNAARVEVADGNTTKFQTDGLTAELNLEMKHFSFQTRKIQALDLIDESYVAGDFNFATSGVISASILGHLSENSEPAFGMACETKTDLSLVSCQSDSKRLPSSLVSHFQRYLGTGFAPGYHGSIIFERLSTDENPGLFKVALNGRLGNVYVEHPALSVGVVGPINLNVNVQTEVNYGQKSIKVFPSQIEMTSSGEAKETASKASLPVHVNGDLQFESLNSESVIRPSGSLNIEVPTTDCQSALHSFPKAFISEISDMELSGSLKLELALTAINGIPEVKIRNSSFDCSAAAAPEIYLANYLNGPFNIERTLPEGKIYIPVDPARPYFTAYNDIPSLVRSAFVSSEDAGFFQHKGVELAAIIGALERNTEEGRAAVGGSTITMQTVKNLFLARDKTISRKAQEIFLAWHLEKTISKERILEIYLNMVEFGPGLYGIGMASQRFFAKVPKELTLKQAIYLASLLPAPVPRYRYFCKGEITVNYDRILRQLLDRMLGLGRISAAQHAEAVSEKIEFSAIERESACGRHNYSDSESPLEN